VFELPSVLDAAGLLDKAFGRAAKATATGADRMGRARNLAVARVKIAGQAIESTLRGLVKGFPSLGRLPPFYRELVDILVDEGRLKKHLGAVDWAASRSATIARDYRRRIGRAQGKEIGRLRQEAYGRLSSVVKQIAPDLDALADARRALRRIPQIDPDLPTIVVAGYPNVGKSSFVRAVSTGRPKIADYPFTTKRVSIGHVERGFDRIQILDTPGLLDRPMEKRNPMERQAISALAHLADGVLFLLDPTETCGYPLADQNRLLAEVERQFPKVPIVVLANKADLGLPTSPALAVSALRGDGVNEALDALLSKVTSRGPGAAPRSATP
jgi:nucleolar GTP-binding protein